MVQEPTPVADQYLPSAAQSGFIKGRSCMPALTHVVKNLRADLDNNMI